MAHQKITVAGNGNVAGSDNTYSYSGSFDVFKGTEVVALLDGIALTYTASTINESASPREYSVDTVAKTIHIGGANLSSGNSVVIRPETDMGEPTPRAEYTPGSSITSADLNNNQLQLMRKAMEYDDQKLSSTGGTMTGDLAMGEDKVIIFEGATDDAHETTLTVVDPTADRTITLPNVTGTVVTTGDTGTVTSTMITDGTIATADIADDAITTAKIADDAVTDGQIGDNAINSWHYVDGSIDTAHIADSQITADKLASNSVTAAKIATNAVTETKIANNNVTSAKINPDAVNGSHIADDSINSEHLVDGSIDTAHIADSQVTHAKLANDAVDGDNIADDSINSEHYVDGSIDTAHIADLQVTTAKIAADAITGAKVADDAIDSEHYTDASIDHAHLANDCIDGDNIQDDAVAAEHIASNAVVNASVASGAAIDHSKLAAVSSGNILVGNGSNQAASVAMSGDVAIAAGGATTIQANAVEIGMIGCEQTTISDSDSHIPTSGAVVDYVSSQISPLGGFEAIADEDNFPTTEPAAGVIISIADATGIQVDNASPAKSTNCRTAGNGSDNVTITGFPDSLKGGATHDGITNANPYTLPASTGLLCISTGSSHTYTFHRLLPTSNDVRQLSDDINDFYERYRIAGSAPGSNNDEGDLYFNTSTNKMNVYDGSTWGEVTSKGDYKLLGIKDNGQAHNGTGPTFNGSNDQYDLFDGTSDANITSAGQLLVSLNGVLQKPNGSYDASDEGFALDGTDGIRFCDPPPSGSTLFITQIGTATTLDVPADNSVTSAKIQDGAVATADLAADAVTGAKIADDAIDSEHYTDGSIDHAHLANDCIDGDNIQDDVVNSEHIAAGAVDLEHMSSESVDEDNLYISNAGSNGQFLSKQSGNNGGLTWATPTDTNTNILSGGTIAGDVVLDNATHSGFDITWDESDKAIEFADSVKAILGTGGDFEIFHDGTNSHIENSTGYLHVKSDSFSLGAKSVGENMILATANGAVELFHDGTKELSTKAGGAKLWGHSEQIVTALTSAGTVTIDFGLSNHFSCTMGHNITFANPSTESVGQSGTITLTQDGTGSRTAAWGTQFLWAGGTAPTLTTTANAVDRIDYVVVAADKIHCVATLALD